jgi:hypothetical protein
VGAQIQRDINQTAADLTCACPLSSAVAPASVSVRNVVYRMVVP